MTRPDAFHRFLADAKQLHLSDREKEEARSALLAHIVLRGADAITLSTDEKAMGRDALIASMRLQSEREISSRWWAALSIPLLRMPALALSALIIVLGSGALAYASESAIPGDPLYALKVDVMEPLREKMNRTPQKQAVWQIRKVERRLQEAQQLAGRGKLTAQNRAELERRISLQVVTLQDTLLPPPSMETHIAAQEVLATTFEKYEASFVPAVAPAALRDPEDKPKKSEEDHLRQFVRERGNAARSEVKFILRKARESDASEEGADAAGEIRVGITVSGSARSRSRSTSVESQSTSEEAGDEDDVDEERGRRSSTEETKSERSSAAVSSRTDSSADASMNSDASTDNAATTGVSSQTEASSTSEEEKALLEKVEEQKVIIERGLLP